VEYQELSGKIRQYPQIYLYGAGVVAYGAYKAIRELFGIQIAGFLITEKRRQPEQIGGVPVDIFGEKEIDPKNSFILIATPEEYHDAIEQSLIRMRFFQYVKLDSHTEYILMGAYLKKMCGLRRIEEYLAETGQESCIDDIGVYMAVSHKDRPLSKIYNEETWVKKIQAGAALTDKKVLDLTDNNGDNISGENALYGELTAAYYVWKHGNYKITGLFHYRRVLSVTEKQLHLLKTGKVDVILPLPFVCYPDASGQYGRYLLQSDIEIMKQVIKEREGEEAEKMMSILETPYLYNYNMLIARKEVFDEYCEWMFPILKEIAYRCEQEKKDRQPRYIGRIGEVLTSIFFMKNEKKWETAHAEKIWRV
jgi:hypothetical protein